MGRYINWDDVVDRYTISGKTQGSKEMDAAYITYAEYELDGMLSNYFTVPFSSNNITAKDLSIDLTYARIANFKTKEMKEFKDIINKKIKGLISGEKNMMLDDGTTESTIGNTIWSSTKDYAPVFDHGSTLDMRVDSGQLLDEYNAKL